MKPETFVVTFFHLHISPLSRLKAAVKGDMAHE
jgi:hypothetical protein